MHLIGPSRKRHNYNQIGRPSKDIRTNEASARSDSVNTESFDVPHLVEADFKISNQGHMRQEIEVALLMQIQWY